MCLFAGSRNDVKPDESVEAGRSSCKHAAPAVWQEAVVVRPVAGVDIEEAGGHDENPNGEVDGVQNIVEYHWFACSACENTRHKKRYDESYEVGRPSEDFTERFVDATTYRPSE